VLAFAGCFDKVPGVEYEDCYFTLENASPELLEWLNDSINQQQDVHRNLQVYQLTQNLVPVALMEIEGAFLREFRISDADSAAAKERVTFSIIVVPESVSVDYSIPNTLPPGGGNPPAVLSSNFRFLIEDVDPDGMRSVTGLRMWWQKVDDSVGQFLRRQFTQGPMSVDNITITTAISSAFQTAQHLDMWMEDVVQGGEPPRTAVLEFLHAQDLQQVVLEVNMSGLVPLQFLPFSTGGVQGIGHQGSLGTRTMTIQVASFTVQ
jgi:hypothetical protein